MFMHSWHLSFLKNSVAILYYADNIVWVSISQVAEGFSDVPAFSEGLHSLGLPRLQLVTGLGSDTSLFLDQLANAGLNLSPFSPVSQQGRWSRFWPKVLGKGEGMGWVVTLEGAASKNLFFFFKVKAFKVHGRPAWLKVPWSFLNSGHFLLGQHLPFWLQLWMPLKPLSFPQDLPSIYLFPPSWFPHLLHPSFSQVINEQLLILLFS